VPKIISERCELVKLCHINFSGPFFETHCRTAPKRSLCDSSASCTSQSNYVGNSTTVKGRLLLHRIINVSYMMLTRNLLAKAKFLVQKAAVMS